MSQCRRSVLKRHLPESEEVLSVSTGDKLNFEWKETIFPGWIWCTDNNGTQAWVPEAYITIEGDKCRMIRDYTSRELELEVGDEVELIEIESEWAFVLNSNNVYGWIPMENLNPE